MPHAFLDARHAHTQAEAFRTQGPNLPECEQIHKE
jgi:hypothetical protein